jgi:hypothetical protein
MTRVSTLLSPWQRQLLVWLLTAWEQRERRREQGMYVGWGIEYPHLHRGTSRSDSAVRSRALQSLERRGFLLRRNEISGDSYSDEHKPLGRTTCLQLTPSGRELAERLILDDEIPC